MKLFIFIVVLPLAIISCINDDSLRPVIPNNLVNANSAKTWVKTTELKNGVNSVPSLNELKITYTLYENGSFREQKYVHIGSNVGSKGHYSLGISESKDTTLTFFYSTNETISFALKYIDPKQLRLVNDSMTWVLETLQPPKVK